MHPKMSADVPCPQRTNIRASAQSQANQQQEVGVNLNSLLGSLVHKYLKADGDGAAAMVWG